MKHNIKVIFVDIDCTIFDHSTPPSRFDMESIDALKEAQRNGIKVYLCTARPYHSVKQIDLLDFFTPDGLIGANGGIVFANDKIIYEPLVPTDIFESLCDIANSFNVNVEGIRARDCFLINDNLNSVKKLFATYPEDIPNVEDYHNQKVIGACLFAYKDLDEKIRPLLPKDFYYFRYHDHGVDVALIPHYKGDGVRIALRHLGFSKDEAMAIGDDDQDIDMFKEVKYSIAMGNAKENVKEAATYITESVTNHGVKKVLEEYHLI